MAVGFPAKTTYANGDVFSASDINDTNGTLNLATGAQWAAGKNKVINGDFGIWQRGTSFTPTNGSYTADRWQNYFDGTGVKTYSQQTFTPGTAPVAGYEGTFFMRLNQSVAGTGATFNEFDTSIENVRTLAGQTATLSFWAKAAATTVLRSIVLRQAFGTGGSPSANVETTVVSNLSISTSWTRYSYTISVPSISGKTIGTTANTSYIQILNNLPLNATYTIDFWGVQLEQGLTATPFQTASASITGELALCQRYYFRNSPGNAGSLSIFGTAKSTTALLYSVGPPTTMRAAPSAIDYGNLVCYDGVTAQLITAATLGATFVSSGQNISFDATSSSLTQYRPYQIYTNNAAGYLGFSAEL